MAAAGRAETCRSAGMKFVPIPEFIATFSTGVQVEVLPDSR